MSDFYFDHAATSFPKPEAVITAMTEYLRHRAGNPGRGSYALAMTASDTMAEARGVLARFFGLDNPERVLLLPSATHALNVAVRGLLHSGDHVLTSNMEHNALFRPLVRMQAEQDLQLHTVAAETDGTLAPDAFADAHASRPRLVAITAGSNVLGARIDLAAIREAIGPEPLLCVDAAQIAGVLPLDMQALGIDLLAVPGHKGLGGPPGVGALLCSERVTLQPLIEGGTGGNSEPRQTPALFPDGYEAGTPNGPGIAGLIAAVKRRQATDLEGMFARKHALWTQMIEGLQAIDGIEIMSCTAPQTALPLVSFRATWMSPAEMAFQLGHAYDIAVRAGLHCAPEAHRVCGSLETGLVRASLGETHDAADVDGLIGAVRALQENSTAATTP